MKLSSVCLYFSIGLFPVYGLTQTGPSPTSGSTSAEPTKTNSSQTPEAQPATNSTAGGQNASSTELSQVVVVGQLDTVRDEIVPSLGATKYAIGQPQIQNESQGSNAPFNKVILQAPGVAQDSYGQLHVRDEHANLQCRVALNRRNGDRLVQRLSNGSPFDRRTPNLLEDGRLGLPDFTRS